MVAQTVDSSFQNLNAENEEKSGHNTPMNLDTYNNITAQFGRFNKKSYFSGLPYSGKVSLKTCPKYGLVCDPTTRF